MSQELIATPFGGRYCGRSEPRKRVSLHRILVFSFYTDQPSVTDEIFRGSYEFIDSGKGIRHPFSPACLPAYPAPASVWRRLPSCVAATAIRLLAAACLPSQLQSLARLGDSAIACHYLIFPLPASPSNLPLVLSSLGVCSSFRRWYACAPLRLQLHHPHGREEGRAVPIAHLSWRLSQRPALLLHVPGTQGPASPRRVYGLRLVLRRITLSVRLYQSIRRCFHD